MLADLTMIATLPVDQTAVQRAIDEEQNEGEVVAQQPEPPHSDPALPKSPEQPIVPPDDPHRTDIDREPSIDPPPTDPPVQAPSEKPGITEPPRPRA
jgi:hypothetical protein